MVLQMKDKQITRIQVNNITSYSADKSVHYATTSSWPVLKLTIGSVALILDYHSQEDRNNDLKKLDDLLMSHSPENV